MGEFWGREDAPISKRKALMETVCFRTPQVRRSVSGVGVGWFPGGSSVGFSALWQGHYFFSESVMAESHLVFKQELIHPVCGTQVEEAERSLPIAPLLVLGLAHA